MVLMIIYIALALMLGLLMLSVVLVAVYEMLKNIIEWLKGKSDN